MTHHTILIVDDEINVLKSFQRSLRREPYSLITVTGGEEALLILEAREISLVISDYNMPKMNGMEFLKQVKTLYPHLLAIMLTGQAELNIAVQAINEAGVYKFIQKPWEDQELKVTIRRAIETIDLTSERDRLIQKVKSRDIILKELESQHPGITKIKRDKDGVMLID